METEKFPIYGSCEVFSVVSGGRNNGEEEDLDGEEDNDLSHECIVYMVCYK